MAYYTGHVANIEELKNVLIEHCLKQQGWVWQNSILSHETSKIHLEITHNAKNIIFRGVTALNNGVYTPNQCRIGVLSSNMTQGEIIFPCQYEFFAFEKEFYLVINYDTDCYQWLAFGRSNYDFSQSGGTGMWLSASLGQNITSNTKPFAIGINIEGGAGNQSLISPTLFWGSHGAYANIWRQSFIHTNLDNDGWLIDGGSLSKNSLYEELLNKQPNQWNSDAILIIPTVLKSRGENKTSIVLQPEYCRFLRIDNYEPEQIIVLGHEKWKVFPFFRKNVQSRDGGYNINHTGTFGWAIRYEG